MFGRTVRRRVVTSGITARRRPALTVEGMTHLHTLPAPGYSILLGWPVEVLDELHRQRAAAEAAELTIEEWRAQPLSPASSAAPTSGASHAALPIKRELLTANFLIAVWPAS